MSEPNCISPLLDGLMMGEAMRDCHGICCYPALRADTGERFAVKIISIPSSQRQLDALLLTGALANELKAQEYFEKQAAGVVQETELLDKVSKTEGFLPCLGTQIAKMQDGIGYQVYLLSPFRHSLEEQLRHAPLTHLAAVNLGLDMCAALASCRRIGYLYLDLKPSNIFITDNRGYCLGDLGFMRMESLSFASYPEKYRSLYTAPEIQDAMSPLNETLDIFALGLTLYQIYNNGQLPFEDTYPDQPLPPPYYADYEMAEIILKACAPLPQDRWQSPAQMGEALVTYMQRNEVNNVPIIPPPVDLPLEIQEPEEFLSDEENDAELAELLAMIPDEIAPPVEEVTEETVDTPDETAESDMRNEEGVTTEVAQMLAQADDLIDHELPEPVMAPDPIEVPIPQPLQPEPEEVPEPPADSQDFPETIDSPEEAPVEAPISPDSEDKEESVIMSDKEATKKISTSLIVRLAAVLLLLVAVGAMGLYYYYNVYIQTIDALSITGVQDQIVVRVDTKADSSKLTVVCTDAYGNSVQSPLTSGVALFNDMKPSTQYTIEITISGNYKLTGQTSGTFTTESQSTITNFVATAGNEDGSVQLSFNVTGPDSQNWKVEYSATNIPAKTASFSGHSVTLNGLNLGATYTFRLIPEDNLYLSGETRITHKVLGTVIAENLTISPENYYTKLLQVSWDTPDGVTDVVWIVRCYSNTIYDQTIETTGNSHVFGLPGDDAVYTIIVTAQGSSKSASVTTEGMTPVDAGSNTPVPPNPGGNNDPVDPNPGGNDDPVDPNPGGNDDPVNPNPGGNDDPSEILTVTNFTTYLIVAPWNMELRWNFTGPKPSGWILTYTANGGAPVTIKCTENYTNIVMAADTVYVFEVRPIDNVKYNSISYTYTSEKHNYYSGNGFSAKDSAFSLVVNDSQEPVFSVATTDTVYLYCNYKQVDSTATSNVTVTFSVRDADGSVINAESITMAWNEIWQDGTCKLQIPSLPTTTGEYAVDLFFDYRFVADAYFSIV